MKAGFTRSTDFFQPNYIWAELCLLSVCELSAQPGWSSQLQERKPKWWFTVAASKQSYPVSDLPFVSFSLLLATSCTAMIKFYFTDPFLFFPPLTFLVPSFWVHWCWCGFCRDTKGGQGDKVPRKEKAQVLEQMERFLVVDKARWLWRMIKANDMAVMFFFFFLNNKTRQPRKGCQGRHVLRK